MTTRSIFFNRHWLLIFRWRANYYLLRVTVIGITNVTIGGRQAYMETSREVIFLLHKLTLSLSLSLVEICPRVFPFASSRVCIGHRMINTSGGKGKENKKQNNSYTFVQNNFSPLTMWPRYFFVFTSIKTFHALLFHPFHQLTQ